jgi:hypothetical protein
MQARARKTELEAKLEMADSGRDLLGTHAWISVLVPVQVRSEVAPQGGPCPSKWVAAHLIHSASSGSPLVGGRPTPGSWAVQRLQTHS